MNELDHIAKADGRLMLIMKDKDLDLQTKLWIMEMIETDIYNYKLKLSHKLSHKISHKIKRHETT